MASKSPRSPSPTGARNVGLRATTSSRTNPIRMRTSSSSVESCRTEILNAERGESLAELRPHRCRPGIRRGPHDSLGRGAGRLSRCGEPSSPAVRLVRNCPLDEGARGFAKRLTMKAGLWALCDRQSPRCLGQGSTGCADGQFKNERQRSEVLVLRMGHPRLRIGDTSPWAGLRLSGNKLLLCAAKTGTLVSFPCLPS